MHQRSDIINSAVTEYKYMYIYFDCYMYKAKVATPTLAGKNTGSK